MTALCCLLFGLWVARYARRVRHPALDLNAVGILEALAAAAGAIGSAIGSAASAADAAVGSAAGAVGGAIGDAAGSIGGALGIGGGGAGAAAGPGAVTGGAADLAAANAAGVTAVGPSAALTPAEGAVMFPTSSMGTSALAGTSPTAGSTFQAAKQPSMMDRIQKLMEANKQGGGDKKQGGEPAPAAPSLHPAAVHPFQIPKPTDPLGALSQSIADKRARIRAFGGL